MLTHLLVLKVRVISSTTCFLLFFLDYVFVSCDLMKLTCNFGTKTPDGIRFSYGRTLRLRWMNQVKPSRQGLVEVDDVGWRWVMDVM